ncbi:hypothetical protein B5C34_09030 [Pacificimonas flava]|uniref:DUF3311 domain-containing protein n=2 Tax=Pacificimonas TaxID=1960290 RepID=A0A219B5D7_9SPHN|nr:MULTISPECIES: DUF3311 domain-containing protein [Pacificimonas]MBZ6379187.1 DUF3311 domain-containing protein [Pacificimonas aurantium]OWV33590.1 hypothetical protein B5C34_09030 [Pacificimonas flava]
MDDRPASRSGWRHYRLLLIIPFIWQIGLVPFANSVDMRVLSLPFPMVWQMVGILVTSGIIATVFTLDRRRDRAEGAPEGEDL